MRVLSQLLTPVLIALMVLTSASLAVARAAPDATGQMVLCTGQGPVVVHFDENGEPVGPPHYCPDCAVKLLAAIAPAPALGPHAVVPRDLVFETLIYGQVAGPFFCAQARDPPLVQDFT